ncbi:MAG: hypothetical protein AB7O66_07740 [Limisphaerales bacterium]
MTDSATQAEPVSRTHRAAIRRFDAWTRSFVGLCLTLILTLPPILTGSSSHAAAPPESIPSPGLERLFRISPRVYSGSSPSTEADFAQIRSLGVTTIVSVDGARPDVERARGHGLRYAHLPIGYDGIPMERQAQLVKSVSDESAVIYVHCHHGQHRGPAAAAVLCLATDGWSKDDALSWLERAGTSTNYPGLFRSLAEFRSVDAATLAKVPPLPEIAPTTALVDSMVAADSHLEHLKAASKAGWKNIPGHPDLEPRHEATLLWELLRELGRQPAAHQKLMVESGQTTEALRTTLERTPVHVEEATVALQAVEKTCAACHKAHRN